MTRSPFAAARSTALTVANRARKRLDLLVDVFVGDDCVVNAGAQRREVRQLDLWSNIDLGGELEVCCRRRSR